MCVCVCLCVWCVFVCGVRVYVCAWCVCVVCVCVCVCVCGVCLCVILINYMSIKELTYSVPSLFDHIVIVSPLKFVFVRVSIKVGYCIASLLKRGTLIQLFGLRTSLLQINMAIK